MNRPYCYRLQLMYCVLRMLCILPWRGELVGPLLLPPLRLATLTRISSLIRTILIDS